MSVVEAAGVEVCLSAVSAAAPGGLYMLLSRPWFYLQDSSVQMLAMRNPDVFYWHMRDVLNVQNFQPFIHIFTVSSGKDWKLVGNLIIHEFLQVSNMNKKNATKADSFKNDFL